MLLTGSVPFYGTTVRSLKKKIMKEQIDEKKVPMFAALSDECKDLVFRMLIKDHTKRITMTECLEHPWFQKQIDDDKKGYNE